MSNSRTIREFEPGMREELPETHLILSRVGIMVHDAVEAITLHGSRGLQGGARPDSDIDLCLIVNKDALADSDDPGSLLRDVLATTINSWHGPVELDLAAVFDRSKCGLLCMKQNHFVENLCETTIDCLGLYKIQKGFTGFVSGAAVDCSKMYPLLKIWERRL